MLLLLPLELQIKVASLLPFETLLELRACNTFLCCLVTDMLMKQHTFDTSLQKLQSKPLFACKVAVKLDDDKTLESLLEVMKLTIDGNAEFLIQDDDSRLYIGCWYGISHRLYHHRHAISLLEVIHALPSILDFCIDDGKACRCIYFNDIVETRVDDATILNDDSICQQVLLLKENVKCFCVMVTPQVRIQLPKTIKALKKTWVEPPHSNVIRQLCLVE